MSAQTGVEPSHGPASERLVDRARYNVERIRDEPNPIFIRELRQSARLTRTSVILAVLVVMMTFLTASIGGIASTTSSPATTGIIIFQVFFSLAYFVVTLVGPAVAANGIASEREGRTWEAVLLTGLTSGQIALGKFLGAYTSVAMYIIMLAPVGALAFLFGGVTALEVVVAFVFLFLVALLSVAFGLAVSSKLNSLRVAIVLTALLAIPLSTTAFLTFGVGLSNLASEAWPAVPRGPPIWLPTAYARAPFDLSYVLFLGVVPVALVALPAWFLYEVTVSNLASPSDDSSSGLKRWYAVATPLVAGMAVIPAVALSPSDRHIGAVAGLAALMTYLAFCVFLFAGEPVGPSRRVQNQWDAERASRLRRFFGPGMMRTASLELLLGLGALAAVAGTAIALIHLDGRPSSSAKLAAVAPFAAYAAGFYVFLLGLSAWLRARCSTPLTARLLAAALLFGVAVLPWIVAAIAGVLAESSSSAQALLVASPSPFYAVVTVALADGPDATSSVIASCAFGMVWTLVGLVLLALARARCTAQLRARDDAQAKLDAMLAEEDAA